MTGVRPVHERSEDSLLRAARLGDEDAFRELIERHGPAMYRYARRLVGGADDAADVTQQALISAWQGLDSFAGRSALRTWLFRLVHRRAVDLQRRRKPVPVDDEALQVIAAPLDQLPSTLVENAELLHDLQRALDELPWQQRSVWLLKEVEGLSYEEIAETLTTSVGSVRGLLHRSRRGLAERMERWR